MNNDSIVEIALREELRDAMYEARRLAEQRDTAKTDYKRLYYEKKLKKHNENAAKVAQALDRVTRKRKERQNVEDNHTAGGT